MSAYDPSFEIELSPDLLGHGDPAAALRAAFHLPYLMRTHGLRIIMFLGAYIATEEDDMRQGALEGAQRALTGFDTIHDFFKSWSEQNNLHPQVREVLEDTRDAQRDALEALTEFRRVAELAMGVMARGADMKGSDYDPVMSSAYRVFHPAMIALNDQMTKAGDTARNRLEAAAEAARKRAAESRARIDSIARTVRLISLNARVEAARAGEAGRAFGVIAEEIKALSEQTEAASAEMGASVEEIMRNFRVA
ncbi:MAG: methyl-accepting chemotaxis protein [Pseudomonadota bacterium]